MKFRKKNLLWISSFIFVFSLPMVTILPYFINKIQQKSFGWNIEKIKQQIQQKEDFIAYIGTNKCPACKEFSNAMKKEKNFLEKEKVKLLFQWYYGEQNFSSKDLTKFFVDLNKIIKPQQKINKTTPQILFFKNGKLKNRWLPNKQDKQDKEYWNKNIETLNNIIDRTY